MHLGDSEQGKIETLNGTSRLNLTMRVEQEGNERREERWTRVFNQEGAEDQENQESEQNQGSTWLKYLPDIYICPRRKRHSRGYYAVMKTAGYRLLVIDSSKKTCRLCWIMIQTAIIQAMFVSEEQACTEQEQVPLGKQDSQRSRQYDKIFCDQQMIQRGIIPLCRIF